MSAHATACSPPYATRSRSLHHESFHAEEVRAGCEQLEERSLLSALSPAQMRHAYGMDAVSFTANGQTVQGTGAGQTIAIIVADHNPFLTSELSTFDSAFGLPNPALNQVNLAGGQTNEGWAQEEAIDVEWSHVMAPGASIMVVEAASDGAPDLMNAVNFARQQPGVSVVSMSWGSSEFRGQRNYDQFFTTPAGHNGVTFVTASGDSGAKYGCAVAGDLAQRRGGRRHHAPGRCPGERHLRDSLVGQRRRTQLPSCPNRSTSVVFSRADGGRRPTLRSMEILIPACPSTSSVHRSGRATGSRSGAPVSRLSCLPASWPSPTRGECFCGGGTLDGPSQTLPYLYAASSSDFRDVTVGSNGYRATRGYDLVTGRGAPAGPTFVTDLASGVIVPVVTGSAKSKATKAKRAVVKPASPALAVSHGTTRSRAFAHLNPGVSSDRDARFHPSAMEAHHAGPRT